MQNFSVLGLPIHLSDDYLGYLFNKVENGQGTHVVTMNSEMAIMAEKNQELAEAIKSADVVVPDGSGVVFYLWRRGKKQKRVAGIELSASLVKKIAESGENYPICFYGGTPEVASESEKRWREKLPHINLIANHGYLSSEELDLWLEKIKQTQPKLILIGLGVPRQEFWISENFYLAPDAIWIGVGGSFDIWAGIKSRAPQFMCDNNLEWLYRLYQEPWRWKRMMALPQFFFKALF